MALLELAEGDGGDHGGRGQRQDQVLRGAVAVRGPARVGILRVVVQHIPTKDQSFGVKTRDKPTNVSY